MNQDWDIKPRAKECFACHAAFTEGQTYCARLTFGPAGYERADFCDPCWGKEVSSQPRYSAWKGEFHLPPPEPLKTVRKETAEFLLRTLIGQEDPARRNVIYILAVMLERKRLLVEREIRTADDGARLVVYEHRKTGESFVVHDPQLRFTELEQVQEEVMALLSGQEASAPPPGADAPAPH